MQASSPSTFSSRLRIIGLFCLMLLPFFSRAGQWNEWHLRAALLRPAFPMSRFFNVTEPPFHPLLEGGISCQYNHSDKNRWLQEFNAGFGYHRFIQAMVPIYTSFGYNRRLGKNWQFGADLGVGYLHSFPLMQEFVLNGQQYERVNRFGHPQGMLKLGLHAQYKRMAFAYENRLQTPFINSYVPLLPYNALSVSYTFPIHHSHCFREYEVIY